MTKSNVTFTPRISLEEAANIIAVTGDQVTNILLGEPGIGKTQILKTLEQKLGDGYDYIYVDCPVKDMMDIGANIPNHTTRQLEYYVASLFKLSGPGANRPKVIMLDEFLKTPKLMQIIYTRLMLEKMVGDAALPEGSIVIGTSNNTSDGLGDMIQGHVGSRVNLLEVNKPDATQWNSWAGRHGISGIIRSWVALNPRCLASYLDGNQDDNPYIFNPRKPGKQYVCPRSLAKANVPVSRRDKLSNHELMACLSGILGESAARSIAAFVEVNHKVRDVADVIADPLGIEVPDDIAVQVMMMFQAVDVIKTQDELNEFMKFVNRIKSSEVQAIFFTMITRERMKLARYNEQLKKWAHDNYELV